ncbi:MAG: DUF4277 domain-containing protein [Blastocatellia bacterium]
MTREKALKELGVVNAIDSVLSAQPEINATYGHLLQVIIVNRLSLDPQPLYRIGEWAAQHGIDHLFDLEAAWLDDDWLGAGLEAIVAARTIRAGRPDRRLRGSHRSGCARKTEGIEYEASFDCSLSVSRVVHGSRLQFGRGANQR